MKKLRRKSGFTLVECIVAMAVLAIMSLLLTMILSVALKIRNENMQLEQDLDKQVEKLASGEGEKENYNNGIKFGDKFTIPGNSDPNVSANKVSGDSDGISKLEFDFNNYFDAMGDPPKLDGNKDPDKIEVGDWEKTAPCFGHVDLKGTVQIIETKNLDAVTKIYDVTWTVKFTVNSYNAVDSVKITLPIGSDFKSWSSVGATDDNQIGYTRKITQYIIMIQPNGTISGADSEKKEQNVEVALKFKISEEDYKNNCENLAKYFGVGDFPTQTSVNVIPTNS